jgi:hypothetical protein
MLKKAAVAQFQILFPAFSYRDRKYMRNLSQEILSEIWTPDLPNTKYCYPLDTDIRWKQIFATRRR